jgi:prepilin-type N-terminal cleavage/methylation domain-containing protein
MKCVENKKGFSLIEVLVGLAIMLTVFVGIIGVYRLSIRLSGQTRARTTAIALANQRIEQARNLAYSDVGTMGGIPSGVMEQSTTTTRNAADFTTYTSVFYVDDVFDGVAPADTVPNDYKRVKVRVSWQGFFSGEVSMLTDIAPRGLESSVGGGNMLLKIFDSFGIGIPQANVHLVNASTSPTIDANYLTNDSGELLIPGAPTSTQSYQITTSKSGFSIDRTYGTWEIANPSKPHATVLEGQLTQTSFIIDGTSTFSIFTVSPFGSGSFADSFINLNNISSSTNIYIGDGVATLATTTGNEYFSSGYFESTSSSPSGLDTWLEFSWDDTESASTTATFKILFNNGTNWVPVPDIDLPGNVVGFGASPIDLIGVSTTTYPSLRLSSNLSTIEASSTPSVENWLLSWTTAEETAIANVPFTLRGTKIIGTDINDDPVYKYESLLSSDGIGNINIPDMETDLYTFSVDQASTGLSLIKTIPEPQPISLAPSVTLPVTLILFAQNSLLATVRDVETADTLFGASVRIYNVGLGYDETNFTDSNGEAFFIPLEVDTYSY